MQVEKNYKKIPKKITKKYLENYSLFYLERYASSSANLRRLLKQRVEKSCKHHGTDIEESMELVDELITRYLECEILNDKIYAISKARGFRNKGNSSKLIYSKLAQKGLNKSDIAYALNKVDQEIRSNNEQQDIEYISALRHAERKRLGSFRIRESNKENIYQKDLASLARAGFSYEISKKALDFNPEEEAE